MDFTDIIIKVTFWLLLITGLTTHTYNTRKHRLVYSLTGHCYGMLLHSYLLFIYFATAVDDNLTHVHFSTIFVHHLSLLNDYAVLAPVYLLIGLQWTFRFNAPDFFNQGLKIWQRDIAHLRCSRGVRRHAAVMICLHSLFTAVTMGATIWELLTDPDEIFLTYMSLGTVWLSFAAKFFFFSVLIFVQYLFRILNENLTQVVEDIRRLPRQGDPRDVVQLEEELRKLGQIHENLKQWVLRFKNMYQVDVLLILLKWSILLSGAFYKLVIFDEYAYHMFGVPECLYMFHICEELLAAGTEAREILEELVMTEEEQSPSVELKRCAEVLYFRSMDELRLEVCGMFELNWEAAFAATEAVFLYVLIFVQWEYIFVPDELPKQIVYDSY